MPLYRIVIEGSGIRTHKGAVGFFSTRTVTQPTREAAEMFVLRTIREDWRSGPSANRSPTKPALKVIDGWPVGLIDRVRRIPDTSYRFYAVGERGAAAAREADFIRAAATSPLRAIADNIQDVVPTALAG